LPVTAVAGKGAFPGSGIADRWIGMDVVCHAGACAGHGSVVYGVQEYPAPAAVADSMHAQDTLWVKIIDGFGDRIGDGVRAGIPGAKLPVQVVHMAAGAGRAVIAGSGRYRVGPDEQGMKIRAEAACAQLVQRLLAQVAGASFTAMYAAYHQRPAVGGVGGAAPEKIAVRRSGNRVGRPGAAGRHQFVRPEPALHLPFHGAAYALYKR